MGATYTRQSSYTDGDTITAAHTNDEFNQLLAAFASSTGHTHDGTSAEGGPITKLLGNTLTFGAGTAGTDITITFDGETSDGVLKWMEDEDYFEFSDDILVASTEKLQFRDTAIYINSSADGQLDLVADTEIQIAATTVDINGNVDISGTLTIGSAGISEAELEILDGATVTTTELNIMDGDTSATSTTVADADRVVFNDAGTMKQVAVTDLAAYFDDEITAMPNLTSVGTLTTLTVDNVIINGTTIGHTDDTDLITLADGIATVAGEVSVTTLDIGGTNVTSTAAELNILDGVTATTSEINLMDGDTTATSTTLAAADRLIVNDAGTMKQVALSDFETFFESALDTTSNITTVGALNSGSITSGFGTIDTGSSTITTTGLITGGSLDIDDVLINGTTIGHTDDTDLITLANGVVTVAGEISVTTLDIGGTNVTSTAAELNILDGVTSTATEINILDGDTSASSVTVADADRVVLNDGGTMKQVAVTDLSAYFDDEITAMPNLVTTAATTVGALDSGSITSGFGTIDTGSSAITTTGVITGGTLEATADTSAGDNAAIGFTSAEGLILTGQGSTSDITVKNDADATVFTVPTGTDDILFPDSARILMGADSDLQISHNGSDSVIEDLGTGNLKIKSNGSGINFQKGDAELLATMETDGAVTLYHDNSAKLATASTGVDITGGFTASDGCTITTADNSAQLTLISTDADANAGPKLLLTRDSGSPADSDLTGEISFNADDDAGNVTTFASIATKISDASNGTESGKIEISNMVAGTSRKLINIKSNEVVINDDSVDVDFRVESDNLDDALFVQGSDGIVGVGIKTPAVASGYGMQIHNDSSAQTRLVMTNSDTGSAGTDGFQIVVHTDTGAILELRESADLRFATGATERMRLASDGDLGVGTSNPQARVDIRTAALGTALQLSDDTNYGVNMLGVSGGFRMKMNGAQTLTIDQTDNADVFHINGSGNIGIGHSSPTADGTLAGVSVPSGARYVHIHDGDGAVLKLTDPASGANRGGQIALINTHMLVNNCESDAISFGTGNSEKMRLDGGGNLVIGTSSALGKLHIHEGTRNGSYAINGSRDGLVIEDSQHAGLSICGGAGNSGTASIAFPNGSSNIDGLISYNLDGRYLEFHSGGSERARLDASGNLLLGTSSNFSQGERLAISYNYLSGTGIVIDSGSGGGAAMRFRTNSSLVGSIITTTSSTGYNTSSDRRLKSNIQDAASASDKIDAIQVRQFDWNVDNSHQDYGLVAQELQPIEPMAVTGNADSDEMMGVDYSKLVPMLIKEIQELRSRVSTLEAS